MLPVSLLPRWSHRMEVNHRARHSRILILASACFVLITAITALGFLGIPNLQRLNLQTGLSWYDYGFDGLYPTRSYVSFEYPSPATETTRWSSQCSDEYTFLSLHGNKVEHQGPLILDAKGNLVWMLPSVQTGQDFRVQEYRGEKFLTFWHGTFTDGHGRGSWTMLDSSYTHRFEVRPVGNLDGDLHDFLITKNDTALITIYDAKPADLSSIGGPEAGYFYDGIFQEIDLHTGKLLFEWRMSDHVPFNSSFEALKGDGKDHSTAYDAYHINSIDKDPQGNFLLSARHLHSITSIDGKTGEVLWTLGGKLNDFEDASNGHATDFAWQHDARWQDNHTITLMDNTAETFLDDATHSRGIAVDLDIPNRVATLRTTYRHPQEVRATSQGNLQVLPDTGNVFVGWGHCAAFTEFSPDGEVLCNTHFGASNWFQLGAVFSYRVFKGNWVGKPKTIPSAAVMDNSVFVSWNGATEIAAWRLEVWDGHDVDDMRFKPADVVKKDDFETEIELPTDLPGAYFRVIALDAKDKILGITDILSKEPSYSFGDFVQSCIILDSWGVVVSFVMIACSVLLIIYWAFVAFTTCRRRRLRSSSSAALFPPCSEQYQLVSPTSSDDTASQDSATRSLLWRISRREESFDDG